VRNRTRSCCQVVEPSIVCVLHWECWQSLVAATSWPTCARRRVAAEPAFHPAVPGPCDATSAVTVPVTRHGCSTLRVQGAIFTDVLTMNDSEPARFVGRLRHCVDSQSTGRWPARARRHAKGPCMFAPSTDGARTMATGALSAPAECVTSRSTKARARRIRGV